MGLAMKIHLLIIYCCFSYIYLWWFTGHTAIQPLSSAVFCRLPGLVGMILVEYDWNTRFHLVSLRFFQNVSASNSPHATGNIQVHAVMAIY